MKKLQPVKSTNIVPLHRPNLNPSNGFETLLDDWLGQYRSKHTQRVYKSAIADFFSTMYDSQPTPDKLYEFFSLTQPQAFKLVSQFHKVLIERENAPATINRKLASIKSFVNYAQECGICYYVLSNIKTEKVQSYRDTSGIHSQSFLAMLDSCDRQSLKGKRDYAILMLLWGNALRRSEVTQTNIGDFDPEGETLRIIGKGRAGQYETIKLGQNAIAAISDWLEARREKEKEIDSDLSKSVLSDPLFSATHKGYWNSRLITHSIYRIVRDAAYKAGIDRIISPHRIRHSAITAALDATDGDVRRVQRLSRHSRVDTLLIYDDNRKNHQGEITNLLDGLF